MARTRVFDVDTAVETATGLFWRNGYERTSLADLTAAMGITPPSFYFAFGSKEGLFKRVLKHYSDTRLGWAEEALQQPTSRGVAECMLYRLADLYTDEAYPPGCLAVNCALPFTDDSASIRREMAQYRAKRRERLRERFQAAKDDGDLPADADADELAHYVMTVGWGLAFAAQSGATRDELYRTVARALQAWPAEPAVAAQSATGRRKRNRQHSTNGVADLPVRRASRPRA
ncbi:HTH-type transcriptional repressor ComR [Paraburkholderia solisilvae]|uniref:HTH-type transcriptional repressor ComR n=2 Tax=Paraburkholderia solisilvae TaxID=624376 RepID=A0A6J5DIL5_9BURK|nr:HTH-type transcriptional repressor ComR [Paraburkholderia solisilvae]